MSTFFSSGGKWFGGTGFGSVTPATDAVFALIGSKAKAHWNADDAIRITIATGVSSWRDSINNIDLAQSTAGFQPAYSATGWNSSAPAITFDGSDDRLDHVGMPAGFPVVGTDDCEIFMLCEVLNDASVDTTIRYLFEMGGTANGSFFGIRRSVTSSINRLNGTTGSSTTSGSPDSSGRVVCHAIFDQVGAGSDAISTFINNVAASTQVTNATFTAGTTRVRLGNSTGLTNPPNVRFRNVIVTSALEEAERTAVHGYLAARI